VLEEMLLKKKQLKQQQHNVQRLEIMQQALLQMNALK
jgi:Tfp pilus assembly protein PilN